MIKVNHDEVKSEIVSGMFYSEVESKLSPYYNPSFGEDCGNKNRITMFIIIIAKRMVNSKKSVDC